MFHRYLSRRELLRAAPFGFGSLALAGMCAEAAGQYQDPLAPGRPHHPARARRVIFLCMTGGPSHVDTFDYKPQLVRDAGMVIRGPTRIGVSHRGGPLCPAHFRFARHGKSGQWISELFPHLSRRADDLCVIRSMVTDIPEHAQAILQLHTGEFRFVRPSAGAWVLYGLGTENRDLPGFITINPPSALHGGTQNHGSAFLPATFQGMPLGETSETINAEVIPPPSAAQRGQFDLIQEMDRDLLQRRRVDLELEGAITSFERGFRMQTSLPQLMNVASEPGHIRESYGAGAFGRQCLVARRLSEAGVRFVEVCNHGWDHHQNIVSGLQRNCREVDQPIAALLTDLKQRGLLDDTLVIWGGEFGRAPTAEQTGRPHNALGYTMWLAGGGVKPGLSFGATDEHGLVAVENPVHVHDLHATVLHLLGLDHQRLTYRYGGRDYSLTDIHGRVVNEILA